MVNMKQTNAVPNKRNITSSGRRIENLKIVDKGENGLERTRI